MRSLVSHVRSPLSLLAAIAAATSVLASPVAANAAAAAPGAPLRVQPQHSTTPGLPVELDALHCTQGPAGVVTLNGFFLANVMITAGHCLSKNGPWIPTDSVYVPKPGGNQLIGYRSEARVSTPGSGDMFSSFVDTGVSADWATVTLRPETVMTRVSQSQDAAGNPSGVPVVLTGVRDYGPMAPGQVSFDNLGQAICKDGDATGRTCGIQLFRTRDSVFTWGLNYATGDSGGVNYDPNNGEALGITSRGIGPLGRAQTIDAVLEDAYGIPDGKLSESFKLAESTEPHDADFRSINEDEQKVQAWADEQQANTPEQPHQASSRETFDALVSTAHRDAEKYGVQLQSQLSSGDLAGAEATVNEAVNLAGQYAETLTHFGVKVAVEDLSKS